MRTLTVPESVQHSSSAREVLRVWCSTSGQHLALDPEAWADASVWGSVFGDVARQVALALAKGDGRSEREVLQRIREAFDAAVAARSAKG